MEIRIDRAEFLTELGPMQGIIERKSTIPVLSHLLLKARGDRLHLAATDLDVSLTSWCQADVEREGGIAVQARKFLEIIRSLSGDEVRMRIDEGRDLTITAGASRFKIHGLAAEDFPTLPVVEPEVQVALPFAELRSMIGKVLFAVSADDSRFQLNGALLKLKSGSFELAATDGHRLAVVEQGLEDGAEEDAVMVPRKALQELQRFDGQGAVLFRRSEHHLSFSVERRELTCRILEGAFPDYERVIARDLDKKLVFDRKYLLDSVQRVALLSGDRARGVRFQLSPGQLVISAANPDLGEASETLPCDHEGEGCVLGINPDYMSQFLNAVDTPQVRLELKDVESQCVGYPVDGSEKRYLCVIMPMRM